MDRLLFGNLVAHASQAALLALGAAVLARALRRIHPQLTLSLWQAVLVATAILPVVQPWTPVSYRLEMYQAVTPDFVVASPASATFVFPALLLPLLGAVLIFGVAARLAWIAIGVRQLPRLTTAARRLEQLPDAVLAAMRNTATSATFYESDLPTPISFGFLGGVVLLPRSFGALDRGSQYLVAYHELLHVRRRDALQSLVEEVVVAILWFYPWIWWVRSRIRLAREQVVDRATAGTRPLRDPYVRTLLGFAGHYAPALPTTSGMWRARELRARIDALYKEVTMSRSRLVVAAAAIVLALGSIAALGATVFPLYSASLSAPQPPSVTTVANGSSRFAVPAANAVQQSAQEDDVVTVGGDVKPPVKTKHVNPVYPEDAKEAGIQGVVIIEAVIDKEGKVANAKVIRSIPELDQAALDAVLQWEFEPTSLKGKAVSVRMTVTINFTLA